MNYYIDGDFEIPSAIRAPENMYFTSVYSSQNSNYIGVNVSSEKQRTINNISFDEVVNFYNLNEPIFKKYEHELGINIWFFEHFRLYFLYRTFHLKVSCIKSFIEKNNNGIVLTSDRRLTKFIDKKNLQFLSHSNTSNKQKSNKMHEVIFLLKQFKWNHKQINKNLIISRIEDDFDGYDQRFGKLQTKCDKILNRDIFNSSKEIPQKGSNYFNSQNVDSIFIRNLLTLSGVLSLLKFRKGLKNLFKELNANQSPEYQNGSIINALFQRNRLSYFVYFLKYKSFCKLFSKTDYNSVLFINENSAQQKAIQYAAFENNVKVYAIQHGAIYDLHPAYMYGKYNTPPKLPTITFTWGNYFTSLLTSNGGYRNDQVKTAGRIEREDIKHEQHEALNSNKEIIVYASQPQPDKKLREKELKDVFAAAKALNNRYLLVIRPHPAEKDDSYFTNIANNIQFNDFIIDRISDLKTHFESCSILITSYSTVGAEFVPYFKPLLILDYLKTDLVNYIKQGVGIPIYNKQELIDTLEKDKLSIDNKAFEKFIDNYFYKKGEKALEIIQNEINL
ncbi:MAG: hypothetical protein AB8B74_10230 [Crocinitomicaceae bacterium]